MLKPSLLNLSNSFKINIKDSGVLKFSFSITSHFVYTFMGMKEWRDGIYQNVRPRVHRE